MKLVIMQPYLFPYVGYFQLLAAADRFVVYDDVAYIKGGWINRNRWLVNQVPAYFTVPVQNASSFRKINETRIAPGGWTDKLLKTFRQSYATAPHFRAAASLLETALAGRAHVAGLAVASLRAVAEYLGVATPIVETSAVYGNDDLRATARVLDICRRERATVYINAIGGQGLYAKEEFAAAGVELRFLRPRLTEYSQFGGPFIPGLSIIDVIAFNSPETVRRMLEEYELT